VKRLFVFLVLAIGLTVLAVERDHVLASIGKLVVEETSLTSADAVVVLGEGPRAAAEAATIAKTGYAPRVLVFEAPPDGDDEVLTRLGIEDARPHEVAMRVLKASGVAPGRITVISRSPDGTNDAVHTVAVYARSHGMSRLIVVANRSHTRRIARLLRREFPNPGAVMVRASPKDRFQPESWWRDRRSARELAMEGLRWLNTFGLGDVWNREPRDKHGSQREP
jgi:uncharacterized SAM-binding protein YcdF (DUF218 family)